MNLLKENMKQLYEYNTPEIVKCIVDCLMNDIGDDLFVYSNDLFKKLREAWCMGELGLGMGADKVKLCKKDPPDLYVY